MPVIGVIEPGLRAARAGDRNGRVGVIGTVGTIASGAYQRAAGASSRSIVELTCAACPGFVEFVEAGDVDSDQVHVLAERLLAPVRDGGVDTLVLGCTHYPLLARTIGDVMGRDVVLVSSADETAFEVRELLRAGTLCRPRHIAPGTTFVTSGDVATFRRLGSRFLGPEVERSGGVASMELTVLGCSGSYGGPAGGACSGYLVRGGATALWVDCGNGTFAQPAAARRVEDLDAVVITHEHPDHCVDIYGLHVLMRYGLEREGLPVFAPEGVEKQLGQLVDGDWGNTFDWHASATATHATCGDSRLRFSRTDHPPPTFAVEVARRQAARVHVRHRAGVERRRVRPGRRPRAVGGDVPARRQVRAPIHLSAHAGRQRRARRAGATPDAHAPVAAHRPDRVGRRRVRGVRRAGRARRAAPRDAGSERASGVRDPRRRARAR